MNKAQFVENVQKAGGYSTKADAERAISAMTGAIEEVLAQGDSIAIPNFATFKTSLLKGKTGKVPGTDRTYTTDDKTVPKVVFSKPVKDKVAAGK